jgi:serine protease Do
MLLLCSPPQARTSVIDSVSAEVQEVFDKSSNAVVKVRTLGGASPLAGTGFFIDDKGTILTSFAVVREAEHAWVEYEGDKVEAKIIGRDSRTNLALLKIDREKTPFLTFGDSKNLRTASGLIGVAYPFNLPLSPSFGLVTGFDVQYVNLFFPTTHIRANLPVSPGQIGGPVLDSQGKVMGVMVLSVEEGKSCYAIPSNSARKIVDDLLQFGEARHSWAGVGVIEGYPDDNGRKPIVVSKLYAGTPAAVSGLRQGDRLLKVNGKEIARPTDLMDVSFFATVGESLDVMIEREGKILTCEVATAIRPAGSATIRNRMLEREKGLQSLDDEGGLALPVNAESK